MLRNRDVGCAARDAVIAGPGRVLGELGRAVDELRAEVADLRRRLGPNSGNSSTPPPTDDLPGKVPPSRKARGKGRVKLIKTLITAAHVAGFDETTLRCGPAGAKKYVLAAVTERYSLFFLGARTLGLGEHRREPGLPNNV